MTMNSREQQTSHNILRSGWKQRLYLAEFGLINMTGEGYILIMQRNNKKFRIRNIYFLKARNSVYLDVCRCRNRTKI